MFIPIAKCCRLITIQHLKNMTTLLEIIEMPGGNRSKSSNLSMAQSFLQQIVLSPQKATK